MAASQHLGLRTACARRPEKAAAKAVAGWPQRGLSAGTAALHGLPVGHQVKALPGDSLPVGGDPAPRREGVTNFQSSGKAPAQPHTARAFQSRSREHETSNEK